MLRGQEARELAGCPHSSSVAHLIHKRPPYGQTDTCSQNSGCVWCRWECEDNACKLQILLKHTPLLDFSRKLTTQRRRAHAAHAFITRLLPGPAGEGKAASLPCLMEHQEAGSEGRCCLLKRQDRTVISEELLDQRARLRMIIYIFITAQIPINKTRSRFARRKSCSEETKHVVY